MKTKFLLFSLMLSLLSITNVWAEDASVGDVLWSENFAHFGTNTPSVAGTGTGTAIWEEATITYAQSSANTKGYNEALAGGTSPELLLAKSNTTWTISGIPTGGATEMALSFKSNKTTFAVTTSTANLSISGSQKSWTISVDEGKDTPVTFDLVIKNTGSSNARIDDVALTVVTAAAGGGSEKADITDSQLAWSEASATVTFGEEPYSLPTLTNTIPVSVSYLSTDESVATISNTGVVSILKVGSTTVKAIFAGNETYNAKTITYTLTVSPAPLTPIEGGIVDELVISDLLTSGTGYQSFSDKQASNIGHSDAVYAGKVCISGANIQMNTIGTNTSAGREIATTTSGGYAKRVQAIWGGTNTANRKLTIYGSNSAYSGTETATSGTKLGELTYTAGSVYEYIDIADDYEYIQIVASGAMYLSQINITWIAPVIPSVAKPSITGTDKFLTSSEITITQDEADAIYYTTNGNEPTTSSTQYTAPFTISETTTVKAIAVKGTDVSAVAEVTFTKAAIMTIAQARDAIDAGGDLTNKYVKGIISQIDSYNSNYHSITYWISDDGTTTDQLEVYSGLAGVVKTQFESENDIHVGEEVIVKGTLKKYNSIYEFDKNNTIEAYKSLSPIAWSTNAYTAELGSSTNEFPTLSGTDGLTITYSSSDPAKAEIAQDGTITLKATGETTITASSAATETYVNTDVSYTLTIEESVVRVSITFVENGGEPEQTDLTEQTNLPNPLPAIAKAGYNFGGWYTDENFQTLAVAGAEITENTTLYAQWLEPYTVAVALVKIAALPDGGETENVYVQGVVTGDVSISGTSAIYDIKDASVDNRLAIYKGKGLNGADVTAGDIQDGDQVVVYGKLYKYVKNQQVTPEVAQGNYLYSLDRPTVTVTGVTLPATASVKVGKTITLTPTIEPATASNKNVTWSITSGDAYASVSSEGVVTGLAAGEAVIQVTTEDGGYTASCTVTVAEAPDFAHGDWILVADANELTAGSYVIIAAAEYDYAMQPWVSGANHCVRKAATKDGDLLTYDSDFAIFEVKDYVVEEVVQGKSFLNVESDGYLCYSSGLKEQATQTNASSWTLNFDANDVFHAFNKNANTYEIQYNKNSGSERFACYTSSQQAIALYKYYAPVPKVLYDKNTEEDVTNLPGTTRAELEDNVYKATISTTTPHRSGYQFTGWKDADNNDYIAGNKYTITDDITLYAQWDVLAGHHITYVTVGTAPTDENTYYAGDAVTLASADGLSNPGYVFDGWNDGANTYPANYDEYQMPDNDVTFTAVWSRMSTQKWVLVENLSDIKTDGTEYVIAAAGYNVAMAALSGDIYTTTPVVKNGNVLTGSESMIPLTFVAGNGDGVLAMKHGDLYLASTAEKKMTERGIEFYWTVSIADGVATFDALIGTNTYHLQYNSGSPRFTTYKSTQKPLAIYEKAPNRVIEDETVNASDLTAGTDVTIKDGGTLTVDGDKQIGDLTVEEGGVVALNNTLTVVGTFTIETTMAGGKSGQLKGANTNNFIAQADAYIDITLGDNGNADKWHAFTVPFPVDALNGIFDLNGNKLVNETNYAIMDYHGDIRAQGKYGWKKFRGTLVPGTFYLMTVDGNRTTYRMKMKAGSNVVADNKKDFYKYAASGEGQATDAGWNGIGNPTLAYGQVNVAVQVLDPVNYVYVTKDANSCNFIVGTPFFYQASATGTIAMEGVSGTAYYAPIRKAVKTTEQIKVSLANENYTDNLFISASEDATADYQVGKDLVKMTMTNTPIVPQIFGVAYKTQLSMVHAPLVGDRATYTLNLYAPADGEYTISAQQTEDAIVYLTYEGSPIWNITAGEYNCDLQKGNNSGFGLMLVRRAPQVTTDIEGANQSQNGVRKLLINGQLFIEKEGKLFNVTGQRL